MQIQQCGFVTCHRRPNDIFRSATKFLNVHEVSATYSLAFFAVTLDHGALGRLEAARRFLSFIPVVCFVYFSFKLFPPSIDTFLRYSIYHRRCFLPCPLRLRWQMSKLQVILQQQTILIGFSAVCFEYIWVYNPQLKSPRKPLQQCQPMIKYRERYGLFTPPKPTNTIRL